MTFFGEFEPKNVVGHRVDPQKSTSLRHNACFETSHVKLHAWVTSVGESGKKIKMKIKEALYFTYFVRRSLTTDWHKFWVTRSSRERNSTKFYRNRLKGFDSISGQSLSIPIGLRYRRH